MFTTFEEFLAEIETRKLVQTGKPLTSNEIKMLRTGFDAGQAALKTIYRTRASRIFKPPKPDLKLLD